MSLCAQIVYAGIRGAEEDVHAHRHEDGDEGADALSVELYNWRRTQEMRRLQIAEHVG